MSSNSSFGMTAALTINGSGMGTGIDVTTMVNQHNERSSASLRLQLKQQSATLSSQSSELSQLNTELTALQTAFQALTDFDGELNYKVATSSDTSQLNAAADSTAMATTHTIVVTNSATTATYSATASNGTELATGRHQLWGFRQFTFKLEPARRQQVTIDSSNDTLNSLASYLNNNQQTYGVVASVVTDSGGARLSLTSLTSGAAGAITMTTTPIPAAISTPILPACLSPGHCGQGCHAFH